MESKITLKKKNYLLSLDNVVKLWYPLCVIYDRVQQAQKLKRQNYPSLHLTSEKQPNQAESYLKLSSFIRASKRRAQGPRAQDEKTKENAVRRGSFENVRAPWPNKSADDRYDILLHLVQLQSRRRRSTRCISMADLDTL